MKLLYVKTGATLLVSGAFSNKDAYNWLPIKLKYVMPQWRVSVEIVKEHKATAILEKEECLCDGYFAEVGAGSEIILRDRAKNGKVILVVSEYGAGRIIATTHHIISSLHMILVEKLLLHPDSNPHRS